MSTPEHLNAVDEEGVKMGPWTETDTHGGVMVGEYLDGRRVGMWRHLAADGRLRSEGGYDRGELHGEWTWYRASGVLLQRGGFDHGDKQGVWRRWDANGDPLDTTTWDRGRKRSSMTS